MSEIIRVMVNPKASSKSSYLCGHQRCIARATDSTLSLDVFSDTRGRWNATLLSVVVQSSPSPWKVRVNCSVHPKVTIIASYVIVFKLNLKNFSFHFLVAYFFLFLFVVEPDVSSIKPLFVPLPISKLYFRESK